MCVSVREYELCCFEDELLRDDGGREAGREERRCLFSQTPHKLKSIPETLFAHYSTSLHFETITSWHHGLEGEAKGNLKWGSGRQQRLRPWCGGRCTLPFLFGSPSHPQSCFVGPPELHYLR